MHRKTLKQLYADHAGKVSDKWSLYLSEYDRLFDKFRDRPIRLLEIGIQNGGSLEIWSKYFQAAQSLVGCDINPECARLVYDDQRISIVVGDANQDVTAEKIRIQATTFDIVIDDGSHRSSDIIRSFAKYFPVIEDGGVFIAEDLHCSYWQEFEGGLFDPFSAISFFKRLADLSNYEHWGVEKKRTDVLNGFFSEYNCNIDEEVLSHIHSVEFINSICVIHKHDPKCNGLGTRFVAGAEAVVVPEIRSKNASNPIACSQAHNQWAVCQSPPDEEYLRLVEWQFRSEKQIDNLIKDVGKLQAEIAQLRTAVAERDQEINSISATLRAMERSTSWRISKPVRILGTQLSRLKRGWARVPVTVRNSGGISNALVKAIRVIHHEGFAGVKQRLKNAERAGRNDTPGCTDERRLYDYQAWINHHDCIDEVALERIKARIATFENPPLFSVLIPTFNPNPIWLLAAIESVQKQIYPHWELCVADDASTVLAVRPLLERIAQEDKRVKVIFREKNGHISAASNSALELAKGDFIIFLDQDDCLHSKALYELANRIDEEGCIDMLYTDEDKLSTEGKRVHPFFKPDWSPHLAISQDYLGHLVCYRASILRELGGVRPEHGGAQNYDLWLRASLKARRIVHVPQVLYHSRLHETAASMNTGTKPSHEAERKAVESYLIQCYEESYANIRMVDGDYAFTYKAEFEIPKDVVVSVIIPTRDGLDLLRPCVESVLNQSSWKNVEVVILDNGSREAKTQEYLHTIQQSDSRVRVIPADIPFNWSRLNNIGARACGGDVFIFLNNDTQVISPNWIESLVGFARLPDVGVVGGLLLFEDGTIQHSGVVVGMGGWADHVFRTQQPSHFAGEPFVSPVVTRNVLAVTGACAAITREKFEELGGFDESFIICGSDVELCLRAHRHGYFNVMCAEARLYHYESKTRTPHVPEEDFKQSDAKYAPYRVDKVDPYYNPNLSLARTMPFFREGANHA